MKISLIILILLLMIQFADAHQESDSSDCSTKRPIIIREIK